MWMFNVKRRSTYYGKYIANENLRKYNTYMQRMIEGV